MRWPNNFRVRFIPVCIAGYVFTFGSFASGAAVSGELSGSEIYQRLKPSVPVILPAICSGAVIAADSVLTAAHCVGDLRKVWIKLDANDPVQAEVVAIDRNSDVALLKPSSATLTKVLPLADGGKLREGDELYTIGHPTRLSRWRAPFIDPDFTYIFSRGIVSKLNDDDLVSDVSVSPGNSGGPVVNSRGEIVGVMSRKRIDFAAGDLALASNLKSVTGLIERQKASSREVAPKWWRASSPFELKLGWVFENFTNRRSSTFAVGANWDLFDRVRLEYLVSASSDVRFYSYGIGPKFVFHLSPYSYLETMVGYAFAYVEDTPSKVFSDSSHWQAQVRWSAFPIALQYQDTRFSNQGFGTWMLWIELGR